MLARLIREPLLHFLVLGAALFGLHVALGGAVRAVVPGSVIVVDEAVLGGLAADHRRRIGAAPTAGELEAAVEAWIDGEALRREARALGLDRADPIVGRRLAQKMEFLLESGEPGAPPDAALAALLDEAPDRFARPARTAFEHAFFDADKRGEDGADAAVRAFLADPDPDPDGSVDRGDPFTHGPRADGTAAELDARFGAGFARALEPLPVGAWTGPVSSRFGRHAVRIEARTEARPGSVAEAREELVAEWARRARATRRTERLAEIRRRYAVKRSASP